MINLLPMDASITEMLNGFIHDLDQLVRGAISVGILIIVTVGVIKSGLSVAKFVALVATAALVVWALMFGGIELIAESISVYFNEKFGK